MAVLTITAAPATIHSVREFTINGLAEITGKESRTVKKRIVGLAPLRADGDSEYYDSAEALPKIYEADSAPGVAADKARRAKAEADSAELDALKKAKTLCCRDDYEANFADGIAQGVRNVSRLRELTDAQKELVFAALRAVKLPDLEETEA